MKHDPITPPPDAALADEIPSAGPRWTKRKMADFLRALSATHSVKDAARAVGMSRQSAYRLRSRLKGLAFDAAWDEAFYHSYNNLPFVALDRAINGTEVQHFYKGEVVGTSRRYDERLTITLLKLFNSGDALMVGGVDPAPEVNGRRLEALLARIESEGEAARTAPGEALPGYDFRDTSPLTDAEIMAEMRRFARKPRG